MAAVVNTINPPAVPLNALGLETPNLVSIDYDTNSTNSTNSTSQICLKYSPERPDLTLLKDPANGKFCGIENVQNDVVDLPPRMRNCCGSNSTIPGAHSCSWSCEWGATADDFRKCLFEDDVDESSKYMVFCNWNTGGNSGGNSGANSGAKSGASSIRGRRDAVGLAGLFTAGLVVLGFINGL